MCGIAGFVGPGTNQDLARMLEAQSSRGPDDSGYYASPEVNLFLGHLRLAVLDLGSGRQPMATADGGLVVIFNGEIYNHAELRAALEAKGAEFRSQHSDTEVLLQAYRHWGDVFVARLNGMWSFVIYDKARRRLFASRDRFGKKPFYYTHRPGFFAFASELGALIAHQSVSREISRESLKKYFAYGYIPAPLSLYRNVAKLPGGCNLELNLSTGQLRTWRWWRFELAPDPSLPAQARAEDAERLRELLARSVQRRLAADVPVGVFLSGGIDSSMISALAAKALYPRTLETFSIGFAEATFDESAYSKLVATHVGSLHHHWQFADDTARAELPALMCRLDEPMGDSSLAPMWFLCRQTRERVTVALSGDGADELFAGYDPFRALRWVRWYQRWLPRPVHNGIAALVARLPVSHKNMSFDFRAKRMLRGMAYPPRLWCPVWMAPLSPAEIHELFAEPVVAEDVFSEAIDSWERCRQTDPVSRLMQFYVDLYLQNDILTKVDRASMAHSLEVRSPFLDIDVVDYVRQLPVSWKLAGNHTKVLLKSAAEPLLPADILGRPKKGFGTPVGEWFRTRKLPSPQQLGHGMQEGFLQKKWLAHLAGDSDERAFLWCAHVLAYHEGDAKWRGS